MDHPGGDLAPVLIVAEGLLMYLHETEARHLLQRLTDQRGSRRRQRS